LFKALSGCHPIPEFLIGEAASVEPMTAEDLRAYHAGPETPRRQLTLEVGGDREGDQGAGGGRRSTFGRVAEGEPRPTTSVTKERPGKEALQTP